MPPLPEETDDDQLTPAVSKHGANDTLPVQQPQKVPQGTTAALGPSTDGPSILKT